MTEILVKIDRESKSPLHLQIHEQIREAIDRGVLGAGTKLPSTRGLAGELGVSRGVVVESYEQLRAEGYVRMTARSRPVVAERPDVGADELVVRGPHRRKLRWDFFPCYPDLDGFPRGVWVRAYESTVKSLAGNELAYGDMRGEGRLRTALAEHLTRARQVETTASGILVTQGVQHGLAVICAALRERGAKRFAFEDPTLPNFPEVIRHSGLEALPIGVDEEGIRVEELEGSGAAGVFLTPAHQFPLGAVLSPERRAQLIEWARRSDAFLFEDDYDAEYRYDRDPVGALQGEAPDRVIYSGSVSKTLVPALRVGWLITPEELFDEALVQKAYGSGFSPIFEQLTLAELIESEALYRHLRNMRSRYRKRREAAIGALGKHLPEARIRGIEAGLNVLAILPPSIDEEELAAAAREREIRALSLSRFRAVPKPSEQGLVLGYATHTEASLGRGITELGLAAGEVRTARRVSINGSRR